MPVKSASRVLTLLEAVSLHQPISIGDLRSSLDIPRSSLHGLMIVLVEGEFLNLDEKGNYVVGLKAFEVGSAWLEATSLESAARPCLRSLVEDLNQIGHLGVLEGRDIIYVMKQENDSPVRLVSSVGRRLAAHNTALGKVLLGTLSDGELTERYRGVEFELLTPQSVASFDALLESVRAARRDGLSIDEGESTEGVTCYAAPILDRSHAMVAALSVSVIDSDNPEFTREQYGLRVIKAAEDVSERLGGGL